MEQLIVKGLKSLNVNSEANVNKLLIYKDFLKKWNKVYNLTALNDDEDIVIKHFFDSLTINEYIQEHNLILDVGTGAGFPGMILALFNPDKKFILVDGVAKKITFLNELKGKLGLKNVVSFHSKVEDLLLDKPVDMIVSRAFSEISNMMKLSKHLLSKEGKFFAMKGPEVDKELLGLGDQINSVHLLKVPYYEGTRKLIIINNK